MFALAAAIVALLALLDVGNDRDLTWWWLMFIAAHFAFGWGLPIPGPPWGQRKTNGS